METDDEPVEVYIDGSRSNHRKAGIGIWWGTDDKRNVSAHSQQRVCHSDATEFEAFIVFLESIGANKVTNSLASRRRKSRHFVVRTDSVNVITGVTVFIPAYREQGWKHCKSSHIEMLQYLDVLLSNAQHRKIDVTLKYVPGHSGNVGNTGADRLARAGARLVKTDTRDWTAERLKLFERIAAADLPEKPALNSTKRKRRQEQEKEEEEKSEEEHDDNENEEGAEGVGSADESDSDDDDGLDTQPSTNRHTLEELAESDDEGDSDSDESENKGHAQDSESRDETISEDDNCESSEDVQPTTKKRKLNTGVASVLSKQTLNLRRSRQRTNKRRKRAAKERLKAAAKEEVRYTFIMLDLTLTSGPARGFDVLQMEDLIDAENRRNVKSRRAAAAQSIKSD